ncbi:MAG: ABC transporter substrate-binding protein [Propionibacteriaceae bacterium]|nr:ABC transporter substrate-binding protein [Propionibacteriaceae bacterium]
MALAAMGLTLAAAMGLTGCGSTSSNSNTTASSAASNANSTVTIFTGQVGNFTAANFNPFNNTGAFLQPTQGVIYEPLFYYNKAAAQTSPTPMLGTSFSWNADGTVLTVQIRQGVKFSDGTPMTADDVVFSENLYGSSPQLNGGNKTYTVKKDSDTQIEFDFTQTSFTQEAQVLGAQAIVPQAAWKDVTDPTSGLNSNPVGTGPYMLAPNGYTPQVITLQKNPNYWGTGADAPAVQYVKYISLSNADAATTALQQGQVDLMGSYLPTLKQIVDSSNGKIAYSNTPQATTSLFACSNAALGCKGPQTDPAVRLAMYYAMDRTQLSTQAVAGFSKPASPTLLLNWVNTNAISDPSLQEVPQSADVAKAKSTLEADGWTMGSNGYYTKDGQELDLTLINVSGWTDYNTMADLLVTQFKAAGIKLTNSEVAQNAWTQGEVSGNFELSLDSVNMGVSSNPYFTYNSYLNSAQTKPVGQSSTSQACTRYSNPAVDAAIKALSQTNDPTKEMAQYTIIQQALMQDMPIIPIYVNQALAEFNTTHATGWPTSDNAYAFPLPWGGNWGFGIILRTIRPA